MTHWQQSIEEILAHWQTQLESSQETGALPLLNMGFSDRLIESVPALFALSKLAINRTDLTSPLCVIGGNGALWTAALCQQTWTARTTTGSHAIKIIYGGADMATTMASTSIMAQPQLRYGEPGFAEVPAGLWHLFAPAMQPGVPDTWSALPFMVIEPQDETANEITRRYSSRNVAHAHPNAGETESLWGTKGDPSYDLSRDPGYIANQWLAYATILLATLLLFSALFV